MNKAVTWNVAGVGFDAREAAREAARRQGKSLGEWLHGVIADHAAETGGVDRHIAGQERIRAVTARLERLSAVAARDRQDERHTEVDEREEDAGDSLRRRLRLVGDESAGGRSRARRHHGEIADSDTLLDEAIDAMELRARKTERRTDEAIASFAKLLEANEQRRESERSGVAVLAEKLAEIEAKLTDRDQNPVKGALARLEARLEQIGRRSEAESGARLSALSSARVEADAEPIRRLEEKLNALLEAVASRQSGALAQTSPIALAAAQGHPPALEAEPPLRRRRLGEAIADIAERQRTLETGAKHDINDSARSDVDRQTLRGRLGDIRRAVLEGGRARTPEQPFDSEPLRTDIGSMAEQLRDLAPRKAVVGVESQLSHLEKRVDAPREDDAGAAIESLRAEVQGIGGRIDARRAPGSP